MATTVVDRLVTEFIFRPKEAGLRRLEQRVKRTQQTLRSLGTGLTTGGLALTGGLTAAVVSAGRFEQELAKIVGLVGVNRDQVQEWGEAIHDLAAATGVGPRKLAEGMFYTASAGLRGKVAFDVLTASAKASAAGLGEVATVVDVVTSAVNAYGAENLSAAQATDELTKAVELGKLAPGSLATAIGRVLPMASKVGVEFAEVGGAIAAMSRTGTNAEEGVVQLSQVLMQMLKPAAEAQRVFAGWGTSAAELRAEMGEKGLLPTLAKIEELAGGDDEVMTKIFGNVRALRAVFDLLGKNREATLAVQEGMANAAGKTDEAFAAMADTLAFRWRQMVARVGTALIRVGDAGKGFLLAIEPPLTRLLDRFNDSPEATKKLLFALLAFGPVLLGLGGMLRVAAFALGGFVPVITVLGKAFAWLRGLAAGKWLIAALGIFSPTGWLLAGLAAAAAAIALLVANWDAVIAALRRPVAGVLNWLEASLDAVLPEWAREMLGFGSAEASRRRRAQRNVTAAEANLADLRRQRAENQANLGIGAAERARRDADLAREIDETERVLARHRRVLAEFADAEARIAPVRERLADGMARLADQTTRLADARLGTPDWIAALTGVEATRREVGLTAREEAEMALDNRLARIADAYNPPPRTPRFGAELSAWDRFVNFASRQLAAVRFDPLTGISFGNQRLEELAAQTLADRRLEGIDAALADRGRFAPDFGGVSTAPLPPDLFPHPVEPPRMPTADEIALALRNYQPDASARPIVVDGIVISGAGYQADEIVELLRRDTDLAAAQAVAGAGSRVER